MDRIDGYLDGLDNRRQSEKDATVGSRLDKIDRLLDGVPPEYSPRGETYGNG